MDLEGAKVETKTGDSGEDAVKSISERILDIMDGEMSEADRMIVESRNRPMSKGDMDSLDIGQGLGDKEPAISPFVAMREVPNRNGKQKSVVFVGIKGKF